MRSSKAHFEDFVKTTVWEDIRKILLVKRSEIRDQLEGGTEVDSDIYAEIRACSRLRGRADELRFLVDLPKDIIDNYDDYSKEE